MTHEETIKECIRQYEDGAITRIEMFFKVSQTLAEMRRTISFGEVEEWNSFFERKDPMRLPF